MKSMCSFYAIILFASFFTVLTAATICQPYSSFKFDCNICTCGPNGREYSCTDKTCPPINEEEQFVKEYLENGHVLLKPRKKNDKFDDDDFILTRKPRQSKLILPYINDEIPISNEKELERNDVDNVKVETIQEVSNEENDVENWDDFNNYNSLKSERSRGTL